MIHVLFMALLLGADRPIVSAWKACATREHVPMTQPSCDWADMDGDEDIDLNDFGILQRKWRRYVPPPVTAQVVAAGFLPSLPCELRDMLWQKLDEIAYRQITGKYDKTKACSQPEGTK